LDAKAISGEQDIFWAFGDGKSMDIYLAKRKKKLSILWEVTGKRRKQILQKPRQIVSGADTASGIKDQRPALQEPEEPPSIQSAAGGHPNNF